MRADRSAGAFAVDVQVADAEPAFHLFEVARAAAVAPAGQRVLRAVGDFQRVLQIGRASCRERVFGYV